MRPLALLLTTLIILCTPLYSQTQEIIESWPELDLYVRLDENTQLFFLASETRDREVGHKDLLLGAHVDVGLPPILRSLFWDVDSTRSNFAYARLRIGIQYLRDDDLATPFNEYRATVLYTPRFRFSSVSYFDLRNRFDLRFRSGDVFWRYALRGTLNYRIFLVEGMTLDPYVYTEAYSDSRYGGFVRSLTAIGASVGVTSWLSPEINYSYMRDWEPSSRVIHAVAIILNITI